MRKMHSKEELEALGPVSYSTEEQDTGLTWIDGKKIYQKTFYSESVGGSGVDYTLQHETLISYEITCTDNNGTQYPEGITQFDTSSKRYIGIYSQKQYNRITLTKYQLGTDTSAPRYYNVYVTVRYTKSE